MKRKAAADIIEALLQERREAENEKRQLQKRIGDIRRQREELLTESISGGSETIEEMDEQIGRLTQEIQEREQKLKNICSAARTISAGD
ncbi:MAG: hypothetical protein IJJ25_09005 [Lachnospiraceae bacterium]|nr:hypothetical protein [Lachnospiraceae bacterium]